jgi:hypothetical protein
MPFPHFCVGANQPCGFALNQAIGTAGPFARRRNEKTVTTIDGRDGLILLLAKQVG